MNNLLLCYNYIGDSMEYFYSWGLLFVLPFTLFCYIRQSNSERIKMIISGTGFGIIAVISSYLFLDYWNPKYLIDCIHIEDFIYGFIFAGILPTIKNIIFKKETKGKLHINIKLCMLYITIFILTFLVIINMLKLNSIYALIATPLFIGIISYIKVKGNIKDILITIIVSLFITVLVYNIILSIYPDAINEHFIFKNVSDIRILRVPLEEWLFALCLGVGSTYTYEAAFDLEKGE